MYTSLLEVKLFHITLNAKKKYKYRFTLVCVKLYIISYKLHIKSNAILFVYNNNGLTFTTLLNCVNCYLKCKEHWNYIVRRYIKIYNVTNFVRIDIKSNFNKIQKKLSID